MDSFKNFDENFKIINEKINEAATTVGKSFDDIRRGIDILYEALINYSNGIDNK